MIHLKRELGVALLIGIALGLIAVSIYFLDCASREPIFERIVYWALSAIFIIIAACLVFISIILAAYIMVEDMNRRLLVF